MKKRYMILSIATFLLVLCITFASQAEFMLMVGKKTTVMDRPEGAAKTCMLYNGAMVQVIEEQEGWMKVQVTGWIKKPGTAARTSTVDDEDENKDIKEKGQRVVDIIKGEKTSD